MADDDDMGAMWRARREHQQAKRRKNTEDSTRILAEQGVYFTSHNAGAHLVVADRFDFWPSTGRYKERKGKPGGRKVEGRGVRNLLSLLQEAAQ